MFSRSAKLKQSAALGAALLALSTLAQGSGALCLLHVSGEGAMQGAGLHHACCHDHGCHHPAPASAPSSQHGARDGVPCPCPEGCWCHVPPQPVELPKSFDPRVELSGFQDFTASSPVVEHGLTDTLAFTTCSPTSTDEESAVLRCARLCRFLI
ncbi:MAG: hypothetical protein KDA37_10380 [Planctomycetales bacterium]|nr:hypothetical protein [Planctomycetales bacterium]